MKLATLTTCVAFALVCGTSHVMAGDLDRAFSDPSATVLRVDQAPRWADLQARLSAPSPFVAAAAADLPSLPIAAHARVVLGPECAAVQTPKPAKPAKRQPPSKTMSAKAKPGLKSSSASCAKTASHAATAPHTHLPAAGSPSERWMAHFQGMDGLAPVRRLHAVDQVVNALPYVSDMARWGVADRWETPQEMFDGGGDCEGFALTKYFALRRLGMTDSDLRVAVVWDRRDREEHAVLLARAGGETWILDNKTEAPVRLADDPDRYRLIYSVNEQDGVRLASSAAGAAASRTRIVNNGRTLVIAVTPRHRQVDLGRAADIRPAGQ